MSAGQRTLRSSKPSNYKSYPMANKMKGRRRRLLKGE